MATDYKALKNGGFMRQKQKDRFSLRLKVVGGQLTAEQLRTVTEAAETYGQGYVHLTSRQGLEIPFVKLADVENIRQVLAKGGVETGVCGPRVRTVTACQGSDICPSGCIETMTLARTLSDRYYGRQLPHKFKFGITGCQNNCLKAEENDMGIKGGLIIHWLAEPCTFCGVCAKACREKAIVVTEDKVEVDRAKCNHCGRCVKSCPTEAWQGQPGYLLSFGGLFGNKIERGLELTPITGDLNAVLKVSDATLDFFSTYGRAGERFRFSIERTGWETLAQTVKEAAANA
ncbi:MAG: 4Fe-4S binding protein [Deltaproteobacteria bacterium]|jgi:dissimilatory sulfite reductase (desulfoviridin) alpha/beta subunit|nr:4Fe-4S binding protein [Deltaproteobacteria bacterium]